MASIPLVALQSKSPDPINIADEQAKVQAIQQQQQQGQMQKLQLDQAKRDQQDQQLFQQAYMSSHGDINAAADEAARRGASPRAVLQWKSAAIDAQTKALDLVTKQGAVAVQQADLAKGAHAAVDAAKPEDKPGVYQQQLQGLQQAGVDVSKFPQEYPGDEAFKFIGVHVQGYSKLIDEAAKQAEVDKNKAQAGEATAAMNKTNALLPSQVSEAGSKAVSAQVEAQNAPQKAALGLKETQATINEKNAQANKARLDATVSQTALSDSARDQAAEKYFSTGQLPSNMGRGAQGTAVARAIMNRAAELHPDANLSANSAEYKANSESLRKLQTSFDQVTAFENTAGKNLDIFLNQAKKVVDMGGPLINKPIRMIAGQVGSADQAAFNAARTTAVAEISKVLNSANASNVVSDSARHEVEGLIGPNASLKQIVSAATILKQDMGNRHESYQQQIQDIQGRIGGKKDQSAAPPSAPQGKPVYVSGKLVGYTTDGKTMTPAQ